MTSFLSPHAILRRSRRTRISAIGALSLALALSTACSSKDATPSADTAKTPTPAATPAQTTDSTAAKTPTPATSSLRVEVNLASRKLTLFDGQSQLETHSVAIGSEKWPTQTGEWTIKQVVINPEWTPPDESWAEERQPRKPGDPLNPLGQAQLVYDPPRTVHGTNQPTSIGKNVSHGSIRMNNAEIVALAKVLLDKTGAGKDAAWVDNALKNKTEKQIVDLPTPVPIKVF